MMNKLTAEVARQDLSQMKSWLETCGISMKEERYLQALEIALPILERQEKGEIAKPIECPFPCGWKELLRVVMNDGAFLAKNLIEGEEVKDIHRHAAFSNTDRLVSVISAILKAHSQPAAAPQVDNEDWIEWGGGECPVPLPRQEVEYLTRLRNKYTNPAGDLRWYHEGKGGDIIAYRVVQQERERGEEG